MIRLGATVFTGLMWLLFRTLNLHFRLEHPGTNPYSPSTGQRYLYCVWHDSMVIPAFAGKQRYSTALISQHADGCFVAQVLRILGMSTIRGSTHRIAPAAIRELLHVSQSQHIVITPDGPRGPNRQMSVGIVHIASRTGCAVIPTAYSSSRCWRIKGSWSDLIIPKPFAKVVLLAGSPIFVPADLRAEGLEPYVALVQTEMDRLAAAADGLAGMVQRAPDIELGAAR